MTQNANNFQPSLQYMWQHCFNNPPASACSPPSMGCYANTSQKPHSVFPVKLAGDEIWPGSECGSLLRWAGCEQLREPAQLRRLPFPSRASLVCAAAAPWALWAKALCGQVRSTHLGREVSISVRLHLMQFGLQWNAR